MDKRDYYDLKENFSIMQNIEKMIVNVSEILEMYPNIEDVSLKDVKDFLIDRYSKFDDDAFNKVNELISKKQSTKQEELIKLYKENKLA